MGRFSIRLRLRWPWEFWAVVEKFDDVPGGPAWTIVQGKTPAQVRTAIRMYYDTQSKRLGGL